jgi:hypothetical protein
VACVAKLLKCCISDGRRRDPNPTSKSLMSVVIPVLRGEEPGMGINLTADPFMEVFNSFQS